MKEASFRPLCFIALVLLFFVSSGGTRADILHLELGVANYVDATSARGLTTEKFRVLDETLEDLIRRDGTQGIIYLNDIEEGGLRQATVHAREWLKARGYRKIQIIPLPGDYNRIRLPHVHSMHLSNPGSWFEHSQLPNKWIPQEENRKIAGSLIRLANLSDTGLRISTHMHSEKGGIGNNVGHPIQTLKRLLGSRFAETQGRPYVYQLPWSGYAKEQKVHRTANYKVYVVESDSMCVKSGLESALQTR